MLMGLLGVSFSIGQKIKVLEMQLMQMAIQSEKDRKVKWTRREQKNFAIQLRAMNTTMKIPQVDRENI